MITYSGVNISRKQFLNDSQDKCSVIYKLTTEDGKTIGMISYGKFTEIGEGKLGLSKIIKCEIVEQVENFNKYMVAK